MDIDKRTLLSQWVSRTFGRLHPPNDRLAILENMEWLKNKDWLHIIIVEIKKGEAYQKNWIGNEAKEKWKRELKEIIGDHVKLMLNSSLGTENAYVGGFQGDGDFIERDEITYNYQFKIEVRRIIKRVKEQEK